MASATFGGSGGGSNTGKLGGLTGLRRGTGTAAKTTGGVTSTGGSTSGDVTVGGIISGGNTPDTTYGKWNDATWDLYNNLNNKYGGSYDTLVNEATGLLGQDYTQQMVDLANKGVGKAQAAAGQSLASHGMSELATASDYTSDWANKYADAATQAKIDAQTMKQDAVKTAAAALETASSADLDYINAKLSALSQGQDASLGYDTSLLDYYASLYGTATDYDTANNKTTSGTTAAKKSNTTTGSGNVTGSTRATGRTSQAGGSTKKSSGSSIISGTYGDYDTSSGTFMPNALGQSKMSKYNNSVGGSFDSSNRGRYDQLFTAAQAKAKAKSKTSGGF